MPVRLTRSLFSRGAGQLGGPRVYTRNFSTLVGDQGLGNETLLSDAGQWTTWGKTTGLDWDDVRVTNGVAHGIYVNAQLGEFADPTALLAGPWAANQEAEAVIKGVDALDPDTCNWETELRLRSSISAHVNTGYEIVLQMKHVSGHYLGITRWNGPFSNFTGLDFVTNFTFGEGSVLRARATDSSGGGGPSVLIQVWIDDVLMVQSSDSSAQRILSGNPGMGFYISPFNTSGCFSTPNAVGFTSYTAREIVT